jgi:hypothetical protein
MRSFGAVMSSIALEDSTLWIRAISRSVLSVWRPRSRNAPSRPWALSIPPNATATGAGTMPIWRSMVRKVCMTTVDGWDENVALLPTQRST